MPATAMPSAHNFPVDLFHSAAGYFSSSLDMVLPHELFAAIYHGYRSAFFEFLVPSMERLEEFWSSVKGALLPSEYVAANICYDMSVYDFLVQLHM